jgi:DnaJ homolog subfamily C member 28
MPDIDDAIEKAMREGKFDDLPGKGKPLSLDENPHEDPDWRLAHHVLKNGGFSLPWIETRKEIEDETGRARQALRRAWE